MDFPSFLSPMFFCTALLLVILSAIIVAVTHYIDKVIKEGQVNSEMAPRFKKVIISTIAILFIGIIASLFMGYRIGYNRFEERIDHFSANDIETYYAEVTGVGKNTITVEGISLNEEKYHREFCYQISGEVSIVCGDKPIPLSTLEEGDLVSITIITGEGHLAGITDIFKITLLNGEK